MLSQKLSFKNEKLKFKSNLKNSKNNDNLKNEERQQKPNVIEYFAKDLMGKKHSIKEMNKSRLKSVKKGLRWLRDFLRKDHYKALFEIGDDAPSVFFEIWYTSADSRIRAESKGYAREFMTKLEKRLLKGDEPPDREKFFSLMFLARIRHEMDDIKKLEVLLEAADRGWIAYNFKNTDRLFDVALINIDNVGTDPWLLLLMRILIMEYNGLLFPKRYPLQWGMKEALIALRSLPLDGPGAPDFHHSFYLATHIVYALGAYQAIKTAEADCPWLFKYLRVSMRYWMKESWKHFKVERRNKARAALIASEENNNDNVDSNSNNNNIVDHNEDDDFVFVDIDGVSEVVDVLRGCGLTDASDRLVCEGSKFLMATQLRAGNWPYWNASDGKSSKKTADSYDFLHPTWVAVQALRDRDFKLDRPAAEKWRGWIYKLIKQTEFAKEPEYEAKWMRFRTTTNKTNHLKSKIGISSDNLNNVIRVPKQMKRQTVVQEKRILNDDDKDGVLRSISAQSNRSRINTKNNVNINTNTDSYGRFLGKSKLLTTLSSTTSKSGSASSLRTSHGVTRDITAIDEAIYLEKRNRALLLLQQVDDAEHARLPALSVPITQSPYPSPIKDKVV